MMAKSVPYTDAECTSKLCTRCGTALPLSSFYTSGKTKSGKLKYASWCKSCVSGKQSEYHKRTWGPEKLARSAFTRTKTVRHYLAYLRGKAIKRGGDVLSLDALELLWNVQGGRCALTGWFMTTELGRGVVPTNCSIDRINSAKGYEVGNVQLVCRAANIAKSDLSCSDFVALCRAVVETHHG